MAEWSAALHTSLMTSILLTLAGIVLLFLGGEALVRGSVSLAERIGISPLLVGMTIVAAGTSAPELVVSVDASLRGASGIALGNVVGSNICNILLILGLSALLKPVKVNPLEVRRDLLVLLVASVALAALMLTGEVGRLAAGALLVAQVVYVVASYVSEKRRPSPATELYEHEAKEFAAGARPWWIDAAFVIGGVTVLVIGSRLMVTGATELARAFDVSEAVIGLTLVALGTSLPELATSVVAAFRGHSDVAVGNVVGSNIFNSLLIVGAAGVVSPLAVEIGAVDTAVMVGAAVFAAVLLARGSLGRLAGFAAVFAYVAYVVTSYIA